jgi:hypothetical protein
MWPRPFRKCSRNYQKIEYDVILFSGEIVYNCYPDNLGMLVTTDGSNRKFASEIDKVRRSEHPNFNEIPTQYQ